MGANHQVLLMAGGLAPITYAVALASADTTLGTSYTDITGCTLSLPAGTWLVIGSASIISVGSSGLEYLKIYNATDTIDYTGTRMTLATSYTRDATVQEIITLAGTKTINMAAKRGGSAGTALRYSDGTIPGTYMHAIQLG